MRYILSYHKSLERDELEVHEQEHIGCYLHEQKEQIHFRGTRGR